MRQVNPLLDTVAQLLELADARLTASQVLDLLGSGPVRRRFRLDDDDLDRLRDLVVRSGVRWGLDGPHRAPFHLDGFAQNTWSAGLDRLLLGVTMAGRLRAGWTWLGTALPLEDVDSGDVERIGRLAEFVDRLAATLARLTGEHPLERWVKALVAGLDVLTDVATTDDWQAGAGPRRAGGRRTCGRTARRHRPARARRRSRASHRAAARPADPRQLPHRHAHVSPRSCRCGRCRTGWSACSGSTTGCSRASASPTATTSSPATRWSASATRAARTAS